VVARAAMGGFNARTQSNVGRALAARSSSEASLHAENGGQAPDPHSAHVMGAARGGA
jgi:hypothetical protein